MPFRYTTSLAKLHFPEDAVYEVSPTDTWIPLFPDLYAFWGE